MTLSRKILTDKTLNSQLELDAYKTEPPMIFEALVGLQKDQSPCICRLNYSTLNEVIHLPPINVSKSKGNKIGVNFFVQNSKGCEKLF